jgi:tetratricopeptide (TPR) repeat protein
MLTQSTDGEWLEWIFVQRKVLRLEAAGRLEEAIEHLDSFLGSQPKFDLAGDALALHSSLREKQGEIELAKMDLQSAHSLFPEANYPRYAIELSLGALCVKQDHIEEAIEWYFRALETASKDLGTSGGAALGSLVELRDFASMNSDQQALCLQVARQAWDLFGLPGEPDMADMKTLAITLVEASTRPLKPSRNEDE